MKTQLLTSKYGFTIFELMIVIAILGLMYIFMSGFSMTPQNELEKTSRLAIGISSTLRNEIQNVMIGKMPQYNGNVTKITKIQVTSSGLIMTYFTGAGAPALGTSSFLQPYYDGDQRYQIKQLVWTGSDVSGDLYTGSGDLIIQGGNIGFSGVSNSNIFLEITVGYNTRSKKITLDRRTGKVTETRE